MAPAELLHPAPCSTQEKMCGMPSRTICREDMQVCAVRKRTSQDQGKRCCGYRGETVACVEPVSERGSAHLQEPKG